MRSRGQLEIATLRRSSWMPYAPQGVKGLDYDGDGDDDDNYDDDNDDYGDNDDDDDDDDDAYYMFRLNPVIIRLSQKPI